jgi:alpha-1,6-mannosyltransferase
VKKQYNLFFILLIIIQVAGHYLISFNAANMNFGSFISVIGLLFFSYWYIFRYCSSEFVPLLLIFSVLLRGLYLFSAPELSMDYYRYYWDGIISLNNINPYYFTPDELINKGIELKYINADLFEKILSANNYSAFLPVSQYIFKVCSYYYPGDIYAWLKLYKILVFTSETGSVIVIILLLNKFSVNIKNSLIYVLNPLVIIELTGNGHTEAFMIFFLLLSILFIASNYFFLASVAMAAAICTKLLPVIFFPYLVKRIGIAKSAVFIILTIILCFMLFIPFINTETLHNIYSELKNYFMHYEYNAGIFYLIKWAGYKIYGENIITTAGIVLTVIAFIVITVMVILEDAKNWKTYPLMMLLSISVFYLLSPFVNPWYITPIVVFSIFSNYRYSVIWSAVIFLSYYPNFSLGKNENIFLVMIEYIILFSVLIYEIRPKLKPEM